MFNMPRSRVVKINQSFYLNVPADEARRLKLEEGQVVDYDVRPLLPSVAEVAKELGGIAKGKMKPLTDDELWGEDWP